MRDERVPDWPAEVRSWQEGGNEGQSGTRSSRFALRAGGLLKFILEKR